MANKHFIIPIFVPHYGCPHDCVFCNQRKITGYSTDVTPMEVKKTIDSYLKTFPDGEKIIELAFYGGSFTGIDKSIQGALLDIPLNYKTRGKIHGIRLSTRPDYIDKDILNFLKDYRVDTIELGVQSLDDSVLLKNGRGHSSEIVYESARLIKEEGFNLGLQMMIGLVGDSKEKSIFTAKEFVKIGPSFVRIYPTLVIKDTFLENKYYRGTYKPLNLNEAIDITSFLIMIFTYYKIEIIRVGLQATENINLGKDVVAGPFHPSFRQLVEAYIYKFIIEKNLNKLHTKIEGKEMNIKIHPKEVSNLVGQKSSTSRYLLKKYGLKKIRVYGVDLARNLIQISIGGLNFTIDRFKEIKEILMEKGII